MNKQDADKNLEEEAVLDALCEYLTQHLPRLQALVPERYLQVLASKNVLEKLYRAHDESVCAEVRLNLPFSSATLSLEAEALEVTQQDQFLQLLQLADRFEIYPLSNGKLKLAFVFEDVMQSMDTEN